MKIETVMHALKQKYYTPIRGLHSKKSRIRKKAEKKYQLSPQAMIRRCIYGENPFMALLQKGDPSWMFAPISLPLVEDNLC